MSETDGHKTKVGHCKRDSTDVYIGRGPGGRDMLSTPIGKRGWLGNPHTVDDYDREGSIKRFRKAFEHRLENDPEFRARVRELAGATLGCWCQTVDDDGPACHGEVIAEHADRLADEEELVTDGGIDETEIDRDEWRADLAEKFRFYIMNPAHSKGVEYSMWVVDGDYEYPVMSSNTGGFVTFNSRHDTVGDHLEPTDEFLDLVGMAFHEAMSFMPPVYFQNGRFHDTAESVYDGAPRNYELWAAGTLVEYLSTPADEAIPELEPLAEWAGSFTEFDVPAFADKEVEHAAE